MHLLLTSWLTVVVVVVKTVRYLLHEGSGLYGMNVGRYERALGRQAASLTDLPYVSDFDKRSYH